MTNQYTDMWSLRFAFHIDSLPLPLPLLSFYLRCRPGQNRVFTVNRGGPYAKTLDMDCISHLSSVKHNVMRHKMANFGLRFCCQLAFFHDSPTTAVITGVGCTIVLDIHNAQDILIRELAIVVESSVDNTHQYRKKPPPFRRQERQAIAGCSS